MYSVMVCVYRARKILKRLSIGLPNNFDLPDEDSRNFISLINNELFLDSWSAITFLMSSFLFYTYILRLQGSALTQ